MSGAMAGMPSGPTFAMVWAAMIRARMPQRLVTSGRGAGSGSRSGTAAGEQRLHRAEVVLGVHAHGGLVGLGHPDGDAVLEEAELLQALRALERGAWQRVVGVEHGTAIRVETHVLPVGHAPGAVAIERDG